MHLYYLAFMQFRLGRVRLNQAKRRVAALALIAFGLVGIWSGIALGGKAVLLSTALPYRVPGTSLAGTPYRAPSMPLLGFSLQNG